MPESADGRTRCGKPKTDQKVRQIATGAARLRTSTVKTPPSSAKALLARNRARDPRETLISPATRARAPERSNILSSALFTRGTILILGDYHGGTRRDCLVKG